MSRLDRADAFYSRWARLYDLVARWTPGIRHVRQQAVDHLDPAVGETMIDMGCGTGPNFRPLRDRVGAAGTIVGVDVAGGALARAAGTIDRAGWANVHVIRADATCPPVASADAVIAGFVLGMFEDPASAVDDWCDLVGPGGRVALLHFAPRERGDAPLGNLLLRGIILASTPGRRQLGGDAMALLKRRVAAGHDALDSRSRDIERSTHWGGIVQLRVGTIVE